MSGGADAAALPPGVAAAAVDEIAAGFPAALDEAAAAACRRLRARGVSCEEAHALEMPATVRRVLTLPPGRPRAPNAPGVADAEQTILEELGLS